jgi:segregation and condensation protein B
MDRRRHLVGVGDLRLGLVSSARQDKDHSAAEGNLPLDRERLIGLRRALEAALIVAEEPLSAKRLEEVTGYAEEELEACLAWMARSYEEEGRGFQLSFVAGGWRFQSHPDLAAVVEHLAEPPARERLSPAALETLAIIAYRQPISRAQISAIRGVDVDGVLRSLLRRGYIAVVGKDSGPGQPQLYGTTEEFLERLGIGDLSELPPLAELVPDANAISELEAKLRERSR